MGHTEGTRAPEVPIPRFLIDELAAHVTGKAVDDLVFTNTRGAVMRPQTLSGQP